MYPKNTAEAKTKEGGDTFHMIRTREKIFL
jgi:hypothetical protein